MGLPLITKVKKGVLDFLQAEGLAELAGYNFFRGIRAGLLKIPAVCVSVVKMEPLFETELDSPYRCTLEISVITKAEFNVAGLCEAAEDAHDAATEAIREVMYPDGVREFVNAENVVNRPVTDFHLGEFVRPVMESVYHKDLKAFHSALTFSLIAHDDDGDA